MLRFLIPAVVLFAAAGGIAFWAYGQTDDGAEADAHVVRWGNVTISVPEGSDVIVAREFEGPELNPPDGGPVLVLFKRESFPESLLLIDAETGEVLQDIIQAADRAAIDEVLATLKVSEQDIVRAPWPYGETPPDVPRETWGRITFIPPDPASGITVRLLVNDPGPLSLNITNGRSTLSIDAETGTVIDETTLIVSNDKDAFDRSAMVQFFAGQRLHTPVICGRGEFWACNLF